MKIDWKKFFFASLFVGGFVSLFASPSPDGLERTLQHLDIVSNENAVGYGLFADYILPIEIGPFSHMLAGFLGILIVFATLFIAGMSLFAPKKKGRK